jgi:hypothetical protein
MYFCPHLCTPRKTSRLVTHPEIALGQARLTPEYFSVGILEKKVYLGGISILSILLSLESGCHNTHTLDFGTIVKDRLRLLDQPIAQQGIHTRGYSAAR